MLQSYTEKFNKIDIDKLIENNFYQNEHQFFWENNKAKEIIIAFGVISEIIICEQSDLNFAQKKIKKELNDIINIGKNLNNFPKFFGGHSFNINNKSNSNWKGFPRGYFLLPKCIITFKGNYTYITLIKKKSKLLDINILSKEIKNIYQNITNPYADKNIPNNKMIINQFNEDISKSNYMKKINKIINIIKIGNIRKVVLSRTKKMKFQGELNLSEIIKKIRKEYPQCINFFIKLPQERIFFGSTPERLIKKKESLIKTEAIAGTIKRGKNNKIDILLENQLKNDKKSLDEHKLVVKEIKNILKPKLIDIKISKVPNILKLKNVQHLITNISGKLKNDISILELVKSLHPTPAVSGYPVDSALKLIKQYEEYDRGWYTGPIGWIDKSDDGDFCVALRSGFINKKTIQLFSGGGIVLNSVPEEEWEETQLKLKTISEIIQTDKIND